MRRAVPRALALVLGCALAWGVLEIGLRLAPGAIAPHLLLLFEPGLRGRIAAASSLQVAVDFTLVERDDGGPPLSVRKPDTRIRSLDEGGPHGEQRTDEIGFCNPPGRYSEQPTLDLVAIGDSFTWCHAVRAEQAWVDRLGTLGGLRTLNLGRGGSGLYEYLQLLLRFGLAKQPRVVVLTVYEGNDLRDAVYYWAYREAMQRDGRPPPDAPESLFPAVTNGVLGRSSYTANLLVAFLTRVWERHTSARDRVGIDFEYTLELGGAPLAFNLQNRDTDEVYHARRLRSGEESLELWDAALERFAALGREHGFAAVVSYMPSAHTSYGERTRFEDPELAPLMAEFSRAQRAFLSERAERFGYAFHDLAPALIEQAARSGASELLYDPSHIHLTPAGHEVVARSLAAFLRERGLAGGSAVLSAP